MTEWDVRGQKRILFSNYNFKEMNLIKFSSSFFLSQIHLQPANRPIISRFIHSRAKRKPLLNS